MDTLTLASLAHFLEEEHLFVSSNMAFDKEKYTLVSGVSCDSRCIEKGAIFFCKGASFTPQYLQMASTSGAVVGVCERELALVLQETFPEIPQIVVSDMRKAMARVSAWVYQYPDRFLPIVGITGTKGKSTTSYMLRAILAAASSESSVGLIGGIVTFDGADTFPSINTTPEAPQLWTHLAHAREYRLDSVVMEVSSQGLKYDRTLGVHFEIGCFLNIGDDHISAKEHPDFEDYISSKLKLFAQSKHAIVSMDTDQFERVYAAARTCETCTLVSLRPDNRASVYATDIAYQEGLTTFVAHTPQGTQQIELPMLGLFNVQNALIAIAAALYMGSSLDALARGLRHIVVPGRMHMMSADTGRLVGVVDYAHNELSCQSLFSSLREQFPGYRLLVITGSAGDKGVSRRSGIAQAVSEWADEVIYTEDDPNFEGAESVCSALKAYTRPDMSCSVIYDRIEAITEAVRRARISQVPMLIALIGKGTDAFMMRQGRHEAYAGDPEVLLQALHRAGYTLDGNVR